MVNLFEPLLLNFIRKEVLSFNIDRKNESNPSYKSIPKQIISSPVFSQVNKPSDDKVIKVDFPEIKSSFFSEEKTTPWLDFFQNRSSDTGQNKAHWNFLFPEIPWSSEQLDWQDEKSDGKLTGHYVEKEDTHSLCLLFESEKTGKIWIYFEYKLIPQPTAVLQFQIQKDSYYRLIRADKEDLTRQLSMLGNVRITVEKMNSELSNLSDLRRGILV